MSKIDIPPLPVLPKQTKLSVLDVEILLHARDRQIVELCAQRIRQLGQEHGEHPEWAQTCEDAIRSLLNEPEGGC